MGQSSVRDRRDDGPRDREDRENSMKRTNSLRDDVRGDGRCRPIVAGVGFIEAAQPAGSTYELQVTGRAGVPADAERRGAQPDVGRRHVAPATSRPIPVARPARTRRTSTTASAHQWPTRRSSRSAPAARCACSPPTRDTELIADINGWFPAGSRYTSTTPARLLDTRPGLSTVDGVGAGDGLRARRLDLRVAGHRSRRRARRTPRRWC